MTPPDGDMLTSTPDALSTRIRNDAVRLGKVIKDSGASAD